jgi:hypothetical protein
LDNTLHNILSNPPSTSQLVEGLTQYDMMLNKYDRFVPETLLRKAYEVDYLDMNGALEALQEIIQRDEL